MKEPEFIARTLKEHFKSIGMTQVEIAERLGTTQGNVGMYLNGKQPFGKRAAEKWSQTFGIKRSWLITGAGPMMEGEMDSYVDRAKGYELPDIPVAPPTVIRAREIDIYEYVKNNEVETSPAVAQFRDFDMWMDCPSEAMEPNILKGDRLALKLLGKEAAIMNGKIYVMDTKSLGMFVRILNKTPEGDYICSATQEHRFNEVTICKDDVINIFQVVGMIRINI